MNFNSEIFDAHFHIIDKNYKLTPNNNYIPPVFEIKDYRNSVKSLNVAGGALVSGSYQGYDQDFLVNSLKKLGKNFVGVARLAVNVDDSEILRLNNLNVRGIRFNIKRLDPINKKDIVSLAMKAFDIAGWHSEFYIESSALDEYFGIIKALPSVSIDHLGLTKKGFRKLLKLVEKGVKVKASGFGRMELNPVSAMKDIYSANPESLIFGTDLPSTRARRPFEINDIKLIRNNFNDEEQSNIFFKNAMSFYRLN